MPRAAFQARFGKPNEFLLQFSRKLVIFTFILLFQPLKLSCSKAFTIWQTPIVLLSFTALKANTAYFSQIPHAGTSQVLSVNMFGEQHKSEVYLSHLYYTLKSFSSSNKKAALPLAVPSSSTYYSILFYSFFHPPYFKV